MSSTRTHALAATRDMSASHWWTRWTEERWKEFLPGLDIQLPRTMTEVEL